MKIITRKPSPKGKLVKGGKNKNLLPLEYIKVKNSLNNYLKVSDIDNIFTPFTYNKEIVLYDKI